MRLLKLGRKLVFHDVDRRMERFFERDCSHRPPCHNNGALSSPYAAMLLRLGHTLELDLDRGRARDKLFERQHLVFEVRTRLGGKRVMGSLYGVLHICRVSFVIRMSFSGLDVRRSIVRETD